MSTTLAIAAVSATMKYLLVRSQASYGINAAVGVVPTVSLVAPDVVKDDQVGLNLFFFRAVPNPGWYSQDHPSRNANGDRTSNPYLALDLHYLITAHGTADFHNEILLGYAMQIFHENPVLTRAAIAAALPIPPNSLLTSDPSDPVLTAIASSGLADQLEQIKFSLYKPSVDETSQIWSALQTSYRPMASYTATVVLIRSSKPAVQAPPVRSYGVYAFPFQRPVIQQVTASAGADSPIVAGSRIAIKGQALRGTNTRIAVGTAELDETNTAANVQIGDSEISLNLPPDLPAGIVGVQVKHVLEIGSPPSKRKGWESNVVPFVLQPKITQHVVSGTGTSRLLRLDVSPKVGPRQDAVLYLNQINVSGGQPPKSYSIDAPPRPAGSAPTATLDFPIPGVSGGTYLMRVQVNGAESPLAFDPNQGYTGPTVPL